MILFMQHPRFRIAGVLAVLMMIALSGVGCSKSKNVGSKQPTQKWAQDMRERINKTVTDPDRATQMLLLTNDLEKAMFEFNTDLTEYYGNIKRVNADYDATREDFEKVISDFDVIRKAARAKVIAIRSKMADLATDEEWVALSDTKATIFEDWQKGTYEQSK